MLNLYDLFKKNAETFYSIHQDGSKSYENIKIRYFLIFSAALIMASISSAFNDNIMMGIITVESIIMGFSFNVMVYIASQDSLKEDVSKYRENRKKAENLNQLSDEIFYNISYFINISLVCIIISVFWISVKSDSTITKMILELFIVISDTKNNIYIPCAISTFNWIWKLALFATTLESLLVFYRLVRRVTFHFQERKKLLSGT